MTIAWKQSITLYQLRVFLTVARHRNYTHAADELYLSQPSVSAQVHELERLIDQHLFEQVGKRLVLTQAGLLLEEHARRVLAAVDEAAEALDDMQGMQTGYLLVAASTTVGNYLLPKALGTFHARFPGVELKLEIKNSKDVCEDVRSGRVELGVIESTIESVDGDLLLTPYRDDELCVIIPPWHPWAGLDEVPVAALAQATLLWREPGSGTRSIIEAALRRAGINPNVSLQLGSTEAIKQAVAANLGISIVSQVAVSAEVTAGWLTTVRISGVALQRTFHLVRRRGGHQSLITEAFLRLLSGKAETEVPGPEELKQSLP
jgi:DNA-binding transcriptional LysR family regulator